MSRIIISASGLPRISGSGLPLVTDVIVPPLLFSAGSGMFNLTGTAASFGPPPTGLPRGWDEDYDAGVAADWFVDAVSGDDGNGGASVGDAFATIGAANTAAAATDVIALRAGTYREHITVTKDTITFKRYGTEQPVVTGQEALTGWTQCSAADSTELGTTLGVASSPVWKKNLAHSAMAVSNASALNLYENEIPINICQSQAAASFSGDKFFFTYDTDFDIADSFDLSGSLITGITDTSVLGGLTSAQVLADAYVYLFHANNTVSRVEITAFDDGTDNISVDGGKIVQSGGAPEHRWNLANCLPKITQGTYGFIDEGDGTSTIYCYPHSAANLTANMTYAARPYIFTIGDGTDNLTLEGLSLLGVGGNSKTTGHCVQRATSTGSTTGHTIKQCLIGDMTNTNGGYGSVYLKYVQNTTIERCSFRQVAGAWATFFQGGNGFLPGDGNKINQCTATKISNAAHRFFTQENFQFTRNDMTNTGFGGHTNIANFYEQCDTILIYGNRARGSIGYMTWQEASRVFVGFNEFQCNNDESDAEPRGIVDQTNATPAPTVPALNYVWNNHCPPAPWDITVGGAFDLGKHYSISAGVTGSANESYYFVNNIAHGGGVQEPYGQPEAGETHWRDQVGYDDTHIERAREGNLYTHYIDSVWQKASSPYFWTINASEAVELTIADVYTDAANSDFTAPVGSPILSHTGVDLATVITAAEAAFPTFDFTKDADGHAFTTTAPKAGCYQNDYNAQINWA